MSSTEQKRDFYSVIVSAQQLDCECDYGKAFVLYLDGIHALTDYLKTEAIAQLHTIGTKSIDYKLVSGVKTLKNCIERLQIISTLDSDPNPNTSASNQSIDDLIPKLSQQSIKNLSLIDNQSKSVNNSTSIGSNTSTNLQKAYKENAFLTKIFETRLKSTTEPSKKASLKLELQRRIAENIELAKSKDKELYHSMHLRQRKSLELAAKKLLQQQNVLNLDNESMIVDNQSQQQLYAQILDYESKNLDLSQQFRCLTLSPNKSEIIEIIERILNTREHPLTEWTDKFQTQIIHIINPLLKQYLKKRSNPQNNGQSDGQSSQSLQTLNCSENGFDLLNEMDINICDLESEALIRHFNNITTDISISHETITLMLTLVMFDNQLYYKPSNYELFREQHYSVHSIVSNYFYPPIWPSFEYLFRIVFHKHEEELKKGINELLESNELEKDFNDSYDQNLMEETANALKGLIQLRSPFEKLQSMVALTRNLCIRMKDNSEQSSEVSADDLVPALCHVVVRSGAHQLISECNAIERLIDQKYLLGEEGYCLSSVMTALKYIQMHSNGYNANKEQKSDNIL